MTSSANTDVHWWSIIVFAMPGLGGAMALSLRILDVKWIPPPVSRLVDIGFMASWVSLPCTVLAWGLAIAWVARLMFGKPTTGLRVLTALAVCLLAAAGSWYGLAFWGIRVPL